LERAGYLRVDRVIAADGRDAILDRPVVLHGSARHEDGRAVLRELARDTAADALRRAGYDRNPSIEIHESDYLTCCADTDARKRWRPNPRRQPRQSGGWRSREHLRPRRSPARWSRTSTDRGPDPSPDRSGARRCP